MNIQIQQQMTPEEKIGANLAGLSALLNQPQYKNPNGEPDFIAKDLLKIEQMVVDNNQEMETTTQHISEKLNNIMATVQIIKDKIPNKVNLILNKLFADVNNP